MGTPPVSKLNTVNTPIGQNTPAEVQQALRSVQRYINAPLQGYAAVGTAICSANQVSNVVWTPSLTHPLAAKQYIGGTGAFTGLILLVPTSGLYFCQVTVASFTAALLKARISIVNGLVGPSVSIQSESVSNTNTLGTGGISFGSFPTTNPPGTLQPGFQVQVWNQDQTFANNITINATIGRIGPPVNFGGTLTYI